ncbi:hypothetical protein [Absicoccus porci]
MTSTAETETTAIKQIAMRNAKQNLLVFDSHKLNVKAFCKFVPLSTFDLVFCDQDPQREWPKLPDILFSSHKKSWVNTQPSLLCDF